MAQVENIEDLQMGDFIQLQDGMWHLNDAAKAAYTQAQAFSAASDGEVKPQFQVNSYTEGVIRRHRLERTR